MIQGRYDRNFQTFSEEEMHIIRQKKVCVIGCGGLGGYIIELLARVGIGGLTAIDGDVFEASNLNRQILSQEKNLGKVKAEAAKERVEAINSEVKVNVVHTFLNKENADELIAGHDLVVDALDNVVARKVLEKACCHEGIPLIHGAIGGWYGQVAVIYPGDELLAKLYPEDVHHGAEKSLGNPAFTPSLVASVQVCESLKVLLNKKEAMKNQLLTIDLLHHEYEVLSIY